MVSAGLVALLLATACERHPASQTIPGYEEKKAARENVAAHKTINNSGAPNAPTFFQKK